MSGEDFMKKADGKMNAMFFKDPEAAYELYIKAAGIFKSEKRYKDAGEAFMKAGDAAMKLQNPGDACMSYAECAKMLKKVDMKKAGAAMDQAVKLNIENNRLNPAARLLKEWGEALEEDEQFDPAIAAYQKAMNYFDAEDQQQSAIGCLAKIAKMLVQLDRFDEAMSAYEKIGHKYVAGTLKHQAKDQFFRAFICRLATIKPDTVMEGCAEARDALDTYIAVDTYFRNTRDAEACELLLQAVEDSDEAKFDEAIGNLDQLKMLDDAKSHILLKIKNSLSDTR